MSEAGDVIAKVFGPEGPTLSENGEYYPDPVAELNLYSNAISLFADAHSRGGNEAVQLYERLKSSGVSKRFISYASYQGYVQSQGGLE